MGLLDNSAFTSDSSGQSDSSPTAGSYSGLFGDARIDPVTAALGGVADPATIQAFQRQNAWNNLITTLGAIGAAGQPSRLPIPTGVALGRGALAGQEAQRQNLRDTLGALQEREAIEAGKINNAMGEMTVGGFRRLQQLNGGVPFSPATSLMSSTSAPALLTGGAPPLGLLGGPASASNSPPIATSGSPAPPVAAPGSVPASSGAPPSMVGGPSTQPPPLFGVASLTVQIRTLMSFPGGQAMAQKLIELLPKAPPGTYVGVDGSLQMMPNAANVAFQQKNAETSGQKAAELQYAGPIASATEWAKVGPTLFEKTNEPYSLSRPGEMRVVPGQGVVAQTPVLTKSVDPNTGATSEEYRFLYNQPGNPAAAPPAAAAPAPSAAGAPPTSPLAQLPAALRYPNNPPSVFNPPVSGGAASAPSPASAPAPDTSGLNAQGLPRFQTALPPAREGAEKKLGEDFGDKDKKAYDAANVTLGSLSQMIHSIEVLNQTPGGWLNTGAGNLLRGDLAKATNSFEQLLNIKPSFDPTQIANWESLNKNTKLMGMQVINQYFGGSREAASIINGATSAVPNSENTYMGARLVASGIEQAAQRERDLYQYKASLLGQNKSLVTAEADFNASHPPNFYTMRGIANAIPDQAVNALLANPKALSAQFDLKYGKGLSQFVLEGGRTGLGAAGSQ